MEGLKCVNSKLPDMPRAVYKTVLNINTELPTTKNKKVRLLNIANYTTTSTILKGTLITDTV